VSTHELKANNKNKSKSNTSRQMDITTAWK